MYASFRFFFSVRSGEKKILTKGKKTRFTSQKKLF